MNEAIVQNYIGLLCAKIVAMYSVSMEVARKAVDDCKIKELFCDNPEFVDHVPLSSWAQQIFDARISQ